MAVFAFLPDNPHHPELAAKVDSVAAVGNSIRLPGGGWLIAYEGTSRALSDLLGVSESLPTGGLIVNVNAYWGRATKDIWEWLELKLK